MANCDYFLSYIHDRGKTKKMTNYRVIHLIVNQEQGCCELVFCTSEVPKGFYVTPRSGANYF